VSATAGRAGFFGKLPARGDFVRSGLPGNFVDRWDEWLRPVLAGSRELLGADWLPSWLEAPVWRFALAPRLCGASSVLGVMLPSVDRAGRHFPLTFAILPAGAAADSCPESGEASAWLDAAEAAGRAALERALAPEQLAALLPPAPGCGEMPGAGSVWWTSGAPRVAPVRRCCPALPSARGFAGMLSDTPPAEPLA
jgi:type VI secretion system protein ImpM